jgi:hypothetical protein
MDSKRLKNVWQKPRYSSAAGVEHVVRRRLREYRAATDNDTQESVSAKGTTKVPVPRGKYIDVNTIMEESLGVQGGLG